MQRTIKYIGRPIETKKPQDKMGNPKQKNTTRKQKNPNPRTEISIPNRKNTHKNTKLNRKTETEKSGKYKP